MGAGVPALDRYLDAVRSTYDRVHPLAAAELVAAGGLLVDTRPEAQRRREGEVPGALVIERNVLEWRLAPTSAHRIPELRSVDQPVIIMCSEGYASSFAAATLRTLGLSAATDLAGGFHAWKAAGLPTVGGTADRPPSAASAGAAQGRQDGRRPKEAPT